MKKFQYICKKIILENKFYCFITVVMMVVFSAMQLYLPVLLQQYIDAASARTAVSVLLKSAFIYLGISFCIYAAGMFKDWNTRKMAWRGTDALRKEAMEKIMTYDQGFFQKNTSGQVIESLENDLNEIERFISATLIPVLINVMYMAGVLVVFYRTNKIVAGIFGVFILVSLWTIYVQQKKDSDVILKERRSHSQVIGFEGEVLKNRMVIHAAGKEGAILSRLEEKFKQRVPLKVGLQKYYYRVWIITLSLLAAANILSLFVGGILYFKNLVTLGMVYLMYSYGNMLKQPFEELQMHIQNFLSAKGSCEKLSEILFYENPVSDGAEVLKGKLEEISLKDITFCYGDAVILDKVSMKIPGGQKVGIFGQSGAGKSTVCKLLCKLAEPQEGKILINQKDIRDYSITGITESFAYVTAGNLVFDTSVRNNFTVFQSDVTDEEILTVLEEHGLLQYFSFAREHSGREMLDQKLNKSMLSQGEAQLLNLSRLFFKKKEIIIFDEASSMIDEKIEDFFYQILYMLAREVTMVIISHNVERLQSCDYIYMMEQGKVVEEGCTAALKADGTSRFRKFIERSWQE